MTNRSKSICRTMLYESCDMFARLPGFEKTYKSNNQYKTQFNSASFSL